jgi:hypothetical protein
MKEIQSGRRDSNHPRLASEAPETFLSLGGPECLFQLLDLRPCSPRSPHESSHHHLTVGQHHSRTWHGIIQYLCNSRDAHVMQRDVETPSSRLLQESLEFLEALTGVWRNKSGFPLLSRR